MSDQICSRGGGRFYGTGYYGGGGLGLAPDGRTDNEAARVFFLVPLCEEKYMRDQYI